MLAFDKFIVAVVRGSPDSETVASLNDMRKMIEENFEKVFRPDRDQILYIRSKKKLELNKKIYNDWCQHRAKGNISCKLL